MKSLLKNQKGFTLIELIVAISILAILMALVYGFLSFGFRNLAQGQKQSDLQYDIRKTSDRLADAVRDAQYATVLAAPPATFAAGTKYLYVSGDKVILRIGSLETVLVPDAYLGHNTTLKFMKKAGRPQVLNYTLTGTKTDGSYSIESDVYIQNIGTGAVEGAAQGSCVAFGPLTDTEAVDTFVDTFDLAVKNGLTNNEVRTTALIFPTAGDNGTLLSYSSSNPSYVSNTGVVNPPPASPSLPGGYAEVTITVTITKGSVSVQKMFTLKIMQRTAMAFSVPNPLPEAIVGQVYSYAFQATGGYGSYTYTMTPVPAGLTFGNGRLYGTPLTAGSIPVTVTAVDANNHETATPPGITVGTTLNVTLAALQLSSVNPAKGTQSKAYAYTISAAGGNLNYRFTATNLPPWLTLTQSGANAGKLSGTPPAAGIYNINVTLSDTAGSPAVSKNYSLEIVPPLTITTATLPDGTKRSVYGPQTISATGGDGNYTFSVSAGALPNNLTISQAGVISGSTPNGAQNNVNFTIKVSDGTVGIDGLPNTATKSYTISIR